MHSIECSASSFLSCLLNTNTLKPGLHPNAIACVGKQSIMVATASTEDPIGCCLQPIGYSVEAVATMIDCFPTQAIAFGWKPGFRTIVVKNALTLSVKSIIMQYVGGATPWWRNPCWWRNTVWALRLTCYLPERGFNQVRLHNSNYLLQLPLPGGL